METSYITHYHPETINFDPSTQIRAVAAYDPGYGFIARIRFMDSVGSELFEYNPLNSTTSTTTYQLGENEELIGVYGNKDKGTWFRNFGFIVKVKQNN